VVQQSKMRWIFEPVKKKYSIVVGVSLVGIYSEHVGGDGLVTLGSASEQWSKQLLRIFGHELISEWIIQLKPREVQFQKAVFLLA